MDRNSVLEVNKNVCVRSIFKSLKPKFGYQFLNSFDLESYDIFRIGHFDKSFYISERVKSIMIESEITGVEYIEQPFFNKNNL